MIEIPICFHELKNFIYFLFTREEVTKSPNTTIEGDARNFKIVRKINVSLITR